MREIVLTENGAGVLTGPPAPEGSGADRLLERLTLVMLAVFALAAPHSIAVTQGAFIAGLVLWMARMGVARRWLVARTPVDVPLLIFVGWTALAVVTSYAPANSVGKLKGVSLFLVLYLFASNIPTRRVAWLLTLLLAVSALGNLWWTYYDRYRGRGLEIVSMDGASPLRRWLIEQGDTILLVDGKPVHDLAALNAAFDEGAPRAPMRLTFLRGEGQLETEFRRKRVRRAGVGPERLGIRVGPGREFRARGYFSHPVTYAETLQMLAAVAAGWTIAAACGRGRRRILWTAGMVLLTVLIAGALIQTETRASLASFAVACVVMAALRGVGRKGAAAVLLGVLLLAGAGGAMILYGRNVTFIDPQEGSTMWRLTVWREGLLLLAEHPILGIGPDAARDRWREWGLGDNGRLPPGHWHSTPLQIAVDRGVPALLAWLALVGVLLVATARTVRRLAADEPVTGDWRLTAAALGAWGAIVGFFASSVVHYNWGDGEVIQMAWALMGILLGIRRLVNTETEGMPERRGAVGESA